MTQAFIARYRGVWTASILVFVLASNLRYTRPLRPRLSRSLKVSGIDTDRSATYDCLLMFRIVTIWPYLVYRFTSYCGVYCLNLNEIYQVALPKQETR